jgi:WD40-like Beta Propeller Repeat
MEIGNGESVQLTFFDDASAASPAWSPDGRKIAFISDQNGTPKVWVMSADGNSARPPDKSNASDTNRRLAWFPSTELVYQQSGIRNFRRMNIDMTHRRRSALSRTTLSGGYPISRHFHPMERR